MACRLRWLTAVIMLAGGAVCEGIASDQTRPEEGVEFQAILDLEQTARLLAILLDSGRAVINQNQPLFDDRTKSDKGFTPDVFERQLADMFRIRSGLDLGDLDAARLPLSGRRWLKDLLAVSKDVVREAQPDINRPAAQAALIPAVYGSRVAGRFTERTGIRMKQTALSPRNPANAPDTVERASLEMFAVAEYPREKAMSEATVKSGIFRLMYPLYMTQQCLDCHGEPKGALDKTGHRREGFTLGQNAGAISVVIPLRP